MTRVAMSRRSLLVGAAGVGLGGLAGCTRGGTSGSSTALTIGLTYIPNVQFSPFYLAEDDRLFVDRGLDVTLRHHGQQEEVFGALLRGDERVVYASADEAMVAASPRPGGAVQDLRTFAVAYQTHPAVVLSLRAVTTLADLKGRRLGVPGHYGSTYYAALAAISGAGLTERDVSVVDVGYTQVQALTTGKVDAVIGFVNNELVQLRATGRSVTSLPVGGSPARLVGPSLVTTGADTAHLADIAAVMKEAEQRIIADPQKALDATAKRVPTLADPAQVTSARAVLEATMPLWQAGGQVSVAVDTAAMDRMAAFLRQAGIITQAPAHPVLEL